MSLGCLLLAFTAGGVLAIEPTAPMTGDSDALEVANSDIKWETAGLGAGLVVAGKGSQQAIQQGGPEIAGKMIELLKDDNAYVAAHIVLTDIWQTTQNRKDYFSKPVQNGFFVHYNGLNATLSLQTINGKSEMQVAYPDSACQQKRLQIFWTERLKSNRAEFVKPNDK